MKKRIKKSKKRFKKKTQPKRPKLLGKVTHYFGRIDVGIIKLKETLRVGEYITFQSKSREFTQLVQSIQLNHKNINTARRGAEIGIKVNQKVHDGEKVFKAKKPEVPAAKNFIAAPQKYEQQKRFDYKPILPTNKPAPIKNQSVVTRSKGVMTRLPFDKTPTHQRPTPKSQPPKKIPRKESKYDNVKFLKF